MADLLPTPQPTADTSAMDPVVDRRDFSAVGDDLAPASPFPGDPAIGDVLEQPPEMIGMYYLG